MLATAVDIEYAIKPIQNQQQKMPIAQWSKDLLGKLYSGRISMAEFELECVYKALETGIESLSMQDLPYAKDVTPEVNRICLERGIAVNNIAIRKEIENALIESSKRDNAWRIQQTKAKNYANYNKLKDMHQILVWANDTEMTAKLQNLIIVYENHRELMFP